MLYQASPQAIPYLVSVTNSINYYQYSTLPNMVIHNTIMLAVTLW